MDVASWIIWLFILFNAVACTLTLHTTPSPQIDEVNLIKSQEPTLQSTYTLTLPVTALAPLATQTPPSLLHSPECVLPNMHPALSSTEFDRYPEVIRDYLNQGGNPDELGQEMYNLRIASQPVAVEVSDLTGDGKDDVVIAIINPDSDNVPPEGNFLIYICSNSNFELAYEQASDPGYGGPGVRYVHDLDADELNEIIVSSPTCGAHTCFESVRVIGWEDPNFENLFVGSTADIPYPDIRIEDEDGDRVYDIIIAGSGFGSVGAGPQRNITYIWSFDPKVRRWHKSDEILGPSNFRIHVLQDAELATKKGDYLTALQLYGRVVHDATLEDWIDPQKEREDLTAYALYKTALIYQIQGQTDFAQATISQLRSTYPPNNPRYAYVQMVEIFQEAYLRDGLSAACENVREFAGVNFEQVLTPLGSRSFGYGNPDYQLEDTCPWK